MPRMAISRYRKGARFAIVRRKMRGGGDGVGVGLTIASFVRDSVITETPSSGTSGVRHIGASCVIVGPMVKCTRNDNAMKTPKPKRTRLRNGFLLPGVIGMLPDSGFAMMLP